MSSDAQGVSSADVVITEHALTPAVRYAVAAHIRRVYRDEAIIGSLLLLMFAFVACRQAMVWFTGPCL